MADAEAKQTTAVEEDPRGKRKEKKSNKEFGKLPRATALIKESNA